MVRFGLTKNDKVRLYFLNTMASLDEKIISLNQRITKLKFEYHFTPHFFPKDPVAYKTELRAMQKELHDLQSELLDFQKALSLQMQREMQQSQQHEVNYANKK